MYNLWPTQHGAVNYISPPPSLAWQQEKRRLVLLGSTGSIGVNALRIIAKNPQQFDIIALAGATNVQLLAEQAELFRPPYLAVYGQAEADVLHKLLRKVYKVEILQGQEGYAELASLQEANTVLSAQVGAAGLRATVAAALAGKVICLANKESLVLAGDLLRLICAHTKASILPVDSEHNALFQMLAGRPEGHISKLIITASGGPFRGKKTKDLQGVSCKDALKNPNWSMGAKISIDSATLMNKGLEVIEAYHLYGVKPHKIEVVVHPQSIIHSLVEYTDNSMLAHMGEPDMCMPIAHCLNWPHAQPCGVQNLDLVRLGQLTFEEPDITTFPCLQLAKRALDHRGGECVVLNAANETAVELFLEGRISFLDIPALIEHALHSHRMNNFGNTPFSVSFFASASMEPEHVQKVLNHIMDLTKTTRQVVQKLAGIQE